MTAHEPESRAPRSSVGCGCGAIVGAVMMTVVTLLVVGYFQSERLRTGSGTPQERRSRVDRVLHLTAMPPGYHPIGAIRIPLFFQTAVLSDRAPEAAADRAALPFARRGFIFMNLLKLRANDAAIEDYFTQGSGGAAGAPEQLMPQGKVAFAPQEVLGRGAVDIAGGRALYIARRGELEMEKEKRPGIASLLYFACDHRDRRLRLGLWFGPDPAPGTASEELDLTGTPADPRALAGFLGYLRVCG